MAQAAESGIDSISDWRTLYAAFGKYKSCDQAAIAEGYDDIVMRLLTRGWDGGTEAAALARKDRTFATFITRHITELSSKADLELAQSNAATKCSADATRLCASIAKRTRAVLSRP